MERHVERAWQDLQAADYGGAADSFEAAIAIASEMEATVNLAVYLARMAFVKQQLGDFQAAEKALLESIDMAKSCQASEVETHSRLILGELLRDTGRLEASIEQFLDAYDLAASTKDAAGAELALCNLGRLFLDRGWAEQAYSCFLEALNQREDSEHKAAILGYLGLSTMELGKFDQAITYYRTAYLEAEFEDDLQHMS